MKAAPFAVTLITALLFARGAALAADSLKSARAEFRRGLLLTAGESGRRLESSNTGARTLVALVDARVRADLDAIDFDPRRFFYAMAYTDFFSGKYAASIEDMELVLGIDLENDEILRFMDRAEEELRRDPPPAAPFIPPPTETSPAVPAERPAPAPPPAQKPPVILTEPAPTPAPKAVAPAEPADRPRPARPAVAIPDKAAMDRMYYEALKAYVRHNARESMRLLRLLLTYDPGNERWNKALSRIRQETGEAL